MSRKTKPNEQKNHSYELEVLAIVEALKKWRIYLLAYLFKIVTDCKAFKMTMSKEELELEHRAGTKIKHVDALSRVFCLVVESSLTYKLREAQKEDNFIRAVVAV